ncbi:MAG: phage major capsid protein [Luteolibacter sp.]
MKSFQITTRAQLKSLSTTPRKWLGRLAPGRCGSILLPLLLTTALQAAEPADPSIKLREQLRSVLLQLRTAQTESANAQAAAATAEAGNKELTDKTAALEKRIATLSKESTSAKAASEGTLTALNNKLAERDQRLTGLQESLEKWKDGYQKAAAVARTKEDERAGLASEIIILKRTLADRETKNISLFNTATEILDRYENYALGKALAAREPFVSTTRVKVENQVQGYKDRILDNRISAPAAKP